MISRRTVAVGLERVGLQRSAYTLWEWGRSVQAFPELLIRGRGQGADGLPLPPPLHRVQVTASPTRTSSSHRATEPSARSATRWSAPGGAWKSGAVLDFGCGCGRVMRRWADVSGPAFFGSDYNPNLINWCREPPVRTVRGERSRTAPTVRRRTVRSRVRTVGVHPSDRAAAARLDGRAASGDPPRWPARASPPAETPGPGSSPKSSVSDMTRDNPWCVTAKSTGTNLCAVFHPWGHVRDLAAGFTVKESLAAGLADGAQDVHIAERM